MTELESGAGCVLYPSGAAAITNAILSFISAGEHILVTGSAYDPTQNFCDNILTKLNIKTTYFDPLIGTGIADLIQPNTRIVFLVPGSITMEVHDLPTIVKTIRAKSPEIVIMIDNTWAAGVYLNLYYLMLTYQSNQQLNISMAIPTVCSALLWQTNAVLKHCAKIHIS